MLLVLQAAMTSYLMDSVPHSASACQAVIKAHTTKPCTDIKLVQQESRQHQRVPARRHFTTHWLLTLRTAHGQGLRCRLQAKGQATAQRPHPVQLKWQHLCSSRSVVQTHSV